MKLSIAIPIHNMKRADFFLRRLMESLEMQTFRDFEIVITKDGKMAENTNAAIKKCRGELIKVLYMDDMLAHPDSLKDIVENFRSSWLITGTSTNPSPRWTDDIETGNNKLGSPSALTILNDAPILFDESMSWLLDCDYYKRMEKLWGKPDILEGINVNIGEGDHQMTHILTDEQKLSEHNYINQKYGK